jgi:FdhD protein
MDDSNKHPEAMRYVRADRISTGDVPTRPKSENVCIIEETAVTIDVESVEAFTILCTPTDKLAMAAGFLFTEGVIESVADIRILKECDDDPNTIRVRLADQVPRLGDTGRNLLISSSCGACGGENLDRRIESLPKVGDTMRIAAGLMRSLYGSLRRQQPLFEATGGAHAAALFDESGEIVSCAEDTGRHNALDKAIGKCLLEGIPTTGRGAALTSRLSLEMVSKCAWAGIELIAAVSAPTSMAIDVASKCNITLCAFVRETRATLFTHPDRVILPHM